jgi:hypothetical protein
MRADAEKRSERRKAARRAKGYVPQPIKHPQCPIHGVSCARALQKPRYCKCPDCKAFRQAKRKKYGAYKNKIRDTYSKPIGPKPLNWIGTFRFIQGKPKKKPALYTNKWVCRQTRKACINVTVTCPCDNCKEYREYYSWEAVYSRIKADPERYEKHREAARQWRKTPKGRAKERKREYMEREANKAFWDNATPEEMQRYEEIVNYRLPGVDTHVDHIIPLSKGGTSHPDNLCVITAAENMHKGSKMPEDWNYHTVVIFGKLTITQRNA